MLDREYSMTVTPKRDGARVHLESWGPDGENPTCHKRWFGPGELFIVAYHLHDLIREIERPTGGPFG